MIFLNPAFIVESRHRSGQGRCVKLIGYLLTSSSRGSRHHDQWTAMNLAWKQNHRPLPYRHLLIIAALTRTPPVSSQLQLGLRSPACYPINCWPFISPPIFLSKFRSSFFSSNTSKNSKDTHLPVPFQFFNLNTGSSVAPLVYCGWPWPHRHVVLI